MQTDSFAALLQSGSGLLEKALGDPGVEKLARSLNLNLRDPAALKGLLARTQQYVDASSEVSASQKHLLAQELTPGQTWYVRDAIRTYRKIAEMR
jgi:hypothetical protein